MKKEPSSRAREDGLIELSRVLFRQVLLQAETIPEAYWNRDKEAVCLLV